jgi:AAA15 family ATPase/GTPase
MLIRFEVSNFRSIHAPVELSMVAVDTDRAEARAIPNLGESLLHVAAIFGPNASGKSNINAALTWVRDAVQTRCATGTTASRSSPSPLPADSSNRRSSPLSRSSTVCASSTFSNSTEAR